MKRYEEAALRSATFGSGDSRAVLSFIPEREREINFAKLFQEGEFVFQRWHHMPSKSRMEAAALHKSCHGDADRGGLIPYYRFPVNNQAKHGVIAPMTPTVEAIKVKVSELI